MSCYNISHHIKSVLYHSICIHNITYHIKSYIKYHIIIMSYFVISYIIISHDMESYQTLMIIQRWYIKILKNLRVYRRWNFIDGFLFQIFIMNYFTVISWIVINVIFYIIICIRILLS